MEHYRSRSWGSTTITADFINYELFRYCQDHALKFTRSRSGNKNDGARVEQKNWATVRQLVGYLPYDTRAELLLLNRIWVLQSQLGNHIYPQQKLISKVRHGAKITVKYDTAATPYACLMAHPGVRALPMRGLARAHEQLMPAVPRPIQTLRRAADLATAKALPTREPTVPSPDQADLSREATKRISRRCRTTRRYRWRCRPPSSRTILPGSCTARAACPGCSTGQAGS
jgi:hypothetical protein